MNHSANRSTRVIREERLQAEPEFRAYWARTALARAVANQLIDYRVKHRLTQTQLGRALGMRQPAVARLEAGEHTPTWETLSLLAGRLGITFLVGIAPAKGHLPRTGPELSEFLQSAIVEQVDSPNLEARTLVAAQSAEGL